MQFSQPIVTSSHLGPDIFNIFLSQTLYSHFLFPQGDRPNFTPIENDIQNYSSVFFSLRVIKYEMRK
jgi:hypothetical protein